MPANQLRCRAFFELLFFRGLAVLGDSFSKMMYAGVKKSLRFSGVWTGWPLAGSCLAARLASGLARLPAGCSLASPKAVWRPRWAAARRTGRLAGGPLDRTAAGWLPGWAGICNPGNLFFSGVAFLCYTTLLGQLIGQSHIEGGGYRSNRSKRVMMTEFKTKLHHLGGIHADLWGVGCSTGRH